MIHNDCALQFGTHDETTIQNLLLPEDGLRDHDHKTISFSLYGFADSTVPSIEQPRPTVICTVVWQLVSVSSTDSSDSEDIWAYCPYCYTVDPANTMYSRREFGSSATNTSFRGKGVLSLVLDFSVAILKSKGVTDLCLVTDLQDSTAGSQCFVPCGFRKKFTSSWPKEVLSLDTFKHAYPESNGGVDHMEWCALHVSTLNLKIIDRRNMWLTKPKSYQEKVLRKELVPNPSRTRPKIPGILVQDLSRRDMSIVDKMLRRYQKNHSDRPRRETNSTFRHGDETKRNHMSSDDLFKKMYGISRESCSNKKRSLMLSSNSTAIHHETKRQRITSMLETAGISKEALLRKYPAIGALKNDSCDAHFLAAGAALFWKLQIDTHNKMLIRVSDRFWSRAPNQMSSMKCTRRVRTHGVEYRWFGQVFGDSNVYQLHYENFVVKDFTQIFIRKCIKHANIWHPVEASAPRPTKDVRSTKASALTSSVGWKSSRWCAPTSDGRPFLPFQQGNSPFCLFYNIANSLAIFGDSKKASIIATLAQKLTSGSFKKMYPGKTYVEIARKVLQRKPHSYSTLSLLDTNWDRQPSWISKNKDFFPMFMTTVSADGGCEHAIGKVHHWIVDANLTHAMSWTDENLDWCASSPGFPSQCVGIENAFVIVPSKLHTAMRLPRSGAFYKNLYESIKC